MNPHDDLVPRTHENVFGPSTHAPTYCELCKRERPCPPLIVIATLDCVCRASFQQRPAANQ